MTTTDPTRLAYDLAAELMRARAEEIRAEAEEIRAEAAANLKAAQASVRTARDWTLILTGWTLASVVIGLVLLLTGCGTEPPRQAAVYVKDCKAAIKVVALPDGTVPSKPALCERLPTWQYDQAVLDATRTLRIKATPTP